MNICLHPLNYFYYLAQIQSFCWKCETSEVTHKNIEADRRAAAAMTADTEKRSNFKYKFYLVFSSLKISCQWTQGFIR